MTDKIETLNKRLKELAENIKSFKENGISEEILEAWLCHKLKMSLSNVRKFMKCYEEFYDNLLKGQILESLED